MPYILFPQCDTGLRPTPPGKAVMAPEENNGSENIDSLFADTPPAPEEKPPKPEPAAGQAAAGPLHFLCSRCGERFATEEPMKFCNKCGGPVNPDRGSGPKLVLLVDDSVIARKKIATILKKLDCQVVEAENGAEGIANARIRHPDFIILDVQMPGMDGLTALHELRKDPAFASTPIVMLTVHSDRDIVTRALGEGANDYMRKDSSVADLMGRLHLHISRLGGGGGPAPYEK